MDLFQRGHFQLHSGAQAGWKIEMDAISDAEWDTLALMLSEVLPTFGGVVGVPRGGLKLADALRGYCSEGPLLIVDDVLTTGASMESAKRHQEGAFGTGRPKPIGAVIFARCPMDRVPAWITPLFVMPSAERDLHGWGKGRP